MLVIILLLGVATSGAQRLYPLAFVVDSPWEFLTGRPKVLKAVFGSEFDTTNQMVRCFYLRDDPNKWVFMDYSGQLTKAPAYLKLLSEQYHVYVVDMHSTYWEANSGPLVTSDLVATERLMPYLDVHLSPTRMFYMKVMPLVI